MANHWTASISSLGVQAPHQVIELEVHTFLLVVVELRVLSVWSYVHVQRTLVRIQYRVGIVFATIHLDHNEVTLHDLTVYYVPLPNTLLFRPRLRGLQARSQLCK